MPTAEPKPKTLSLTQVIRKKCIDCCGGQIKEVARCHIDRCPLHPYRMGTNPFRQPRVMTPEQLERARERGKAIHKAKSYSPDRTIDLGIDSDEPVTCLVGPKTAD